jgi:RNA recognition motif-containing protein
MENKIFVGNLSFSLTDETFKEAFEKFGTVTEAIIIKNKFNDRSKGFGFVTFENDEDAKKAVEGMNEQELDGRKVTVNVAKPREE